MIRKSYRKVKKINGGNINAEDIVVNIERIKNDIEHFQSCIERNLPEPSQNFIFHTYEHFKFLVMSIFTDVRRNNHQIDFNVEQKRSYNYFINKCFVVLNQIARRLDYNLIDIDETLIDYDYGDMNYHEGTDWTLL